MKRSKVMLAAVCLMLFTACSHQVSSEDVEFIDQSSDQVEAPVTLVEAYDDFFDQLSSLDEEVATQTFYQLENEAMKVQLQLVETIVLNEEIQLGLAQCYGGADSRFDIEAYAGERQEEIGNIYAHGFTFVPFNGVMYPVINYHDFEQVTPYVTRECASYIGLKTFELDDYMSGYDLTQEDLVERLMAIETYLTTYSESQERQVVYELYKTYLYEFIPLKFRTPSTLEADDALFENYDFFIEAHGNTVTAKLLRSYMDVILENHYVIDDKALDVLDQFNDQIESYFDHAIT